MNLINEIINGWRIYNHALVPICPPDNDPNLDIINNKNIWNINNQRILFIRWTDNFDINTETNFWYVIKDKPFDINILSSHYRNQIKKGIRNFEVKKINPFEYEKNLIEIQEKAYKEYDADAHKKIEKYVYEDCEYLGIFNNEKILVGYIVTYIKDKCINFSSMRTIPEYEKQGISEGAVYGLLNIYKKELENGMYINDGSRSVLHNTRFQEFLIKKFGFRKAYCRLNIVYNPIVQVVVLVLYPFRNIIKNRRIKATLIMQEIINKDAKLFNK